MATALVKPVKTRPRTLGRLTGPQQVFLSELQADPKFNATEAARRAGYEHPAVAASKLLNNPLIKAALGHALHKRQEKLAVKAEDLLQVLSTAAMLDPLELGDYCEDDGTIVVKRLDELPEHIRRCLEVVCITKSRKIVLKPIGKAYAIEMLMRHLGMFNDKLTVESKTSIDWDKLAAPLSEMETIEVRLIEHDNKSQENAAEEPEEIKEASYTVKELVDADD